MCIKELANGVLQELETQGYAQSTLSFQRDCIFKQIICWFDNKNGGEYIKEYIDLYLNELSDLFNFGEIKKYYYDQLLCAINRIREYAENCSISLIKRKGNLKFQPSGQAITTIESALELIPENRDFKRKAHCILRALFCFIEARGLCEKDITLDVIVSFVHTYRDVSSGYMARIIRSLRILIEYLFSTREMQNSPDFRFIALKHRSYRIISPYSEKEISDILSAVDKSTAIGKRNYAIILLAIGTGLRPCDIVKLKLADINWKAQTISIVQSKTGKSLNVSISGQICNAIADYIINGRPKVNCCNIFLRGQAPIVAIQNGKSLWHIIESLCNKAGIEKKPYRSFYSLRRTFGTWLASEDVKITMIAQMLGHVEVDSSKPYISFNDLQIFSCAMGFNEIIMRGGVYCELC